MADVGKGAVVGAGSVVVDAVPNCAVAVGNPARIVEPRESVSTILEKTAKSIGERKPDASGDVS